MFIPHIAGRLFSIGTVTRVSQVMAQPRQHHADLIAIRDFQLRLFMAQGLDEGHGQIGGADAVEKTVVGGTWQGPSETKWDWWNAMTAMTAMWIAVQFRSPRMKHHE